MSNEGNAFDLEEQIRSWSDCLRASGHLTEEDLVELEQHLRDEITDLAGAGLDADEAFLIGVKRLGGVDSISQEYAKINTENLWRQLLLPAGGGAGAEVRRDIGLIAVFSLIAGTLAKIPEFLGYGITDPAWQLLYLKNAALFFMPLIAAYFAIKRNAGWIRALAVMCVFPLSALLINIYPSLDPNQTELLTGIHLPLFLWLATGLAYLGRDWRSSPRRMDFIRFTGETFIYSVLICCGVAVLAAFTQLIFAAIQVDLSGFTQRYLFVYGFCAAPIVTVYLVEAKKSIVENFAPTLAKIFSPLFLAVMAAFLIVTAVLGKSPFVDRDFLIGFDIMLALVLGLVLYVISSRDPHAGAGFFDYLNFALISAALVIDCIALAAILFRLSTYGASPNKVAALGENIALFANLAGLAVLYLGYFTKKIGFARLERWQTGYLGVYMAWTAAVAFLFPVVFGFH